MAFRRALVLLVSMSSISCGLVYDFDDYQAAPGAGGGGQAGAGGDGGSGGSGGAGGGAGGSGGCGVVDHMKDPQNCGACGVDCAGGECTGGFCTPVSTDLGIMGQQVASLGDRVFVVRGNAPMNAQLVSYPAEFLAAASPDFTEAVCDHVGFISAGPSRVYFRPQNGEIPAMNGMPAMPGPCGTSQFIYSCNAAPSCEKTMYSYSVHINGAAVVETDLYFTLPTVSNEMHVNTLNPDGVPSGVEGAIVPVTSMEGPASSAFLLSYDPSREALWWTTYGGCILRADVDKLPLMMAPCYPQKVPSTGQLVIASKDHFYVGGVMNGIWKIDPEATMAGEAPPFGAPTLILLGADSDYVYAFDGSANPNLIAFRHGSSPAMPVERARISFPPGSTIASLDALHPKYVFFTMGSSLYRWRKPSP